MTQYPAVDVLCYFVTADPPTVGHRAVVAYALSCLPAVNELRIVPPREHVWGKLTANFEHRFTMIQMTMRTIDPRIHVSRVETVPSLSGYTVDTLSELIRQEPGIQFGIVMGSDAVDTFHLWRDWKHILDLAVVYVCPRGVQCQAEHEERLPTDVKAYVGSRIYFLPDADGSYPLNVSSTDARADIAHRGMTDKVTPDVMSYIQEHNLYGTQ